MAKKTNDPGLGFYTKQDAKGIINNDGSSNVNHINRKKNMNDLYTYFIDISWVQFFSFIITGYIILNVVFGLLYVMIGIEEITKSTGSFFVDFLNGFFFSAQTLTTVGYGGITPTGVAANFIAAFEAMIGLLSFSFITGLLYGRFSKPNAIIEFSDNLIIRDFNNGKALMFRLMNSRKTVMIEPEITVTLAVSEKDSTQNYTRNFYELKLERDKIIYLPTIWTIVHQIDQESPLAKYSKDEFQNLDAQLYILVSYHEESFAQKVYKIHTYNFNQIKLDVKYAPASFIDENGFTVLNHEKLSEVIEI